MRSVAGRIGVVLVGAAAVTVGLAGPASAHVEVSADKAQAGATDVTVSFSAESESKTAGIVSLRVALAPGIAASDVSWASGPTGWALTGAADGYTVAGPALPAGEDAKYAVKIAKLPADATELPFKTVQTYSDGHIDRWIEIPSPGAAEPDKPAPMLKVQPAAAAPPSTAGTTPSAAEPAPAAPTTTASAADAAKDSSSSAAPWWIAGTVAVVAALGAAAWWAWWARRRTAATSAAR